MVYNSLFRKQNVLIPLESVCNITACQDNENFQSRTPTSEVFRPLPRVRVLSYRN